MQGQPSQDSLATQNFRQFLSNNHEELVDTLAKSDKTSPLFLFFLTYKVLFSNNDVPKMCLFHPTCGNYGALAVRKYGFLLGVLKTTDRLLRCHNFHYANQYLYLPSKNKYVDQP